MNPIYNHIGIAICFNEQSGTGTMRILMAENVGKQQPNSSLDNDIF